MTQNREEKCTSNEQIYSEGLGGELVVVREGRKVEFSDVIVATQVISNFKSYSSASPTSSSAKIGRIVSISIQR